MVRVFLFADFMDAQPVIFNGVSYSPARVDDAISRARAAVAANHRAIARDARSHDIRPLPRDPEAVAEYHDRLAAELIAGKYDSSFTIQQIALALLTGECLPLLP